MSYAGWARVELLGHRTLYGVVSEDVQFGATMIRIEVPDWVRVGVVGIKGPTWIRPESLYQLTPVTEEKVRSMCLPYYRPELSAPAPAEAASEVGDDDGDDLPLDDRFDDDDDRLNEKEVAG